MHCWSAAASHCNCSKKEKPEQVIILFTRVLKNQREKEKVHPGEKTGWS